MRRILTLVLAVALVATPVLANQKVFNDTVNVTDVNQTVTFINNHSGGDSAAFLAREILIRSDSASASTCYFDPLDDTATTGDIALEPGASILWPMGRFYTDQSGYAEMGVICGGGGTATWAVTAAR
jgi:hypothetical protein